MQEQTDKKATLSQLISEVLPNLITPIPTKETLRAWFKKAKIPQFKVTPGALRGGGPVYYSVSSVEKLFRKR